MSKINTFKILMYGFSFFVVAIFVSIFAFVLINGLSHINLTMFDLSSEESVVISIINTINIIISSIFLAGIFGIGGSVYLAFYTKQNSLFYKIISLSSNTLAAIPSIVYGLFGYLAFVIFCGFKISFISGTLTLSIMCMPIILSNTLEAIKSVDITYQKAAYALGASKLRVVYLVLFTAKKEIISGLILSIAKVISESAALIYTFGTLNEIASLNSSGRTLSVHLYVLASEGLYLDSAYASSFILMIFIFIICFIINYLLRRIKWIVLKYQIWICIIKIF